MIEALFTRLFRSHDKRIRNEERAQFRRIIERVMEANEEPAVLLALGQMLELIESDG